MQVGPWLKQVWPGNRLPPDPVSPRRPALRPEWLKVLFWPQLPSAPEPNSHACALGAVAHMSTDEGLVQAEAHRTHEIVVWFWSSGPEGR